MLGDQESIANNAVRLCSTYDDLVDVCEEIKVVLDSELPIEEKSDRIFRELSTFISENDDPYNSTRPNDDLWTKETERHVRAMIALDRKTLSESPETKIVHFMEYQFFLHKRNARSTSRIQSTCLIVTHTILSHNYIRLRWVMDSIPT